MPPKLSDATDTAPLHPTPNNDVVQQAAAQAAAMLAVPYITSDSDDDDGRMLPQSANPSKSHPVDSSLPPTEPICESMPPKTTTTTTITITPVTIQNPDKSNSNVKHVTSDPKSEALIAKPDVTMTENNGILLNGNNGTPNTQGNVSTPTTDQNQTSEAMPIQHQNQHPNEATTDNGTFDDTINVSRSCLDGVLEELASRITALEQIRERKKQRVERLSSAAMMAQNTPTPMWPQSAAMVAAQNVLGAGAAAGAPVTATAPMTPNFVPPTTAPKVSVPTPPAPPPAPDANNTTGERKQSRYWTADEHDRFLAAIKTCGAKNYVRIAELVGTRNAKQVRTHAQKFQKKLEREEAKRRDDLRRHGGAAAASSVSAAAVAAVAAAAAAMHQGVHLPPDQAAAYPHLLLPYGHPGVPLMMPSGGAPAAAQAAVALQRPHDGSSSTNDVSVDHQHAHAAEPFVAPETVAAAVAAEAAALGSRVYSRPQQGMNADGNKDASVSNANATPTNQATTMVESECNNTPMRTTTTTASGSGGGTEAKTAV